MKFHTITTNYLREEDFVEVGEIEAKDEDEAYKIIEEESHNWDKVILLNQKQYDRLKKHFTEVSASITHF